MFHLNFWYMKSPHLVYNVCKVCNNFVFSMLYNDNYTSENKVSHLNFAMAFILTENSYLSALTKITCKVQKM